VLRYNLFMRIMSVTAIAPFGVGVLGLFGLFPGPEAPKLVSAGLLLLGVFGFLEFNFVSITFDELGLVARSPWRRSRTIPWGDVRGHSRSAFSSRFSIHTTQGKVRVEDSMSGREELIALVIELMRRRDQG